MEKTRTFNFEDSSLAWNKLTLCASSRLFEIWEQIKTAEPRKRKTFSSASDSSKL